LDITRSDAGLPHKGAHLNAMKTFKKIATGKVYGFETAAVPDWQEVPTLWRDKGRSV